MNVRQIIISVISAIVKIAILIYLITYITKWTATAYDFGYRIFTEEPVSIGEGVSYSVTFEKGASVRNLAKTLEEYGLIRDANLFYVQYLASDYRNNLVPGTYELSSGMDSQQMMEIMSQKDKEQTSGSTANPSTSEAETDAETEGAEAESAENGGSD